LETRSQRYWSQAPATIDGVLGGVENVHETDILDSRAFVESLDGVGRDRALDCGAGIGRVSKHVLCPLFKLTDVMESAEQMIAKARSDLPEERIGQFLQCSVEHAVLSHSYDLVVLHWVAAYLADDTLVSFLARCKATLRQGGMVFLKDNIASANQLIVDDEDGSRIRSDKQYKFIFAKAGLACVKEARPERWPRDLYPAKMYAVR
jgi:protein N-terminal methyltransferase